MTLPDCFCGFTPDDTDCHCCADQAECRSLVEEVDAAREADEQPECFGCFEPFDPACQDCADAGDCEAQQP